MAEDKDWARGFARQALSDLEARENLVRAACTVIQAVCAPCVPQSFEISIQRRNKEELRW
jgi:hypothetical protein